MSISVLVWYCMPLVVRDLGSSKIKELEMESGPEFGRCCEIIPRMKAGVDSPSIGPFLYSPRLGPLSLDAVWKHAGFSSFHRIE